MTTYTTRLRTAVQLTGENNNTWGDVANAGVFQLLEDAIAGMSTISLTAGNVTLTANNGATDQARSAILNLTGAPGAARTVTVPSVSKLYLINNATTGGQTITIKTAAGVGVAVGTGASWVWSDGVDVYATTSTASNSTSLGGILAAQYARLDVQQGFSKAQSVTRVVLVESGGSVAVNAANSNAFRLTMQGNWTIANPTGGLDGQSIRILIVQDGTGSRIATWGAKYRFPGGVDLVLSTAANSVDYVSFEYDSTLDIWVGGGVKGLA
jgi:hypothetical protein